MLWITKTVYALELAQEKLWISTVQNAVEKMKATIFHQVRIVMQKVYFCSDFYLKVQSNFYNKVVFLPLANNISNFLFLWIGIRCREKQRENFVLNEKLEITPTVFIEKCLWHNSKITI